MEFQSIKVNQTFVSLNVVTTENEQYSLYFPWGRTSFHNAYEWESILKIAEWMLNKQDCMDESRKMPGKELATEQGEYNHEHFNRILSIWSRYMYEPRKSYDIPFTVFHNEHGKTNLIQDISVCDELTKALLHKDGNDYKRAKFWLGDYKNTKIIYEKNQPRSNYFTLDHHKPENAYNPFYPETPDIFDFNPIEKKGFTYEDLQLMKGEQTTLESESNDNQQTNKYATIWSKQSHPNGELIDKQEFDDIVAKKDDYDILIIDHGQLEKGLVCKMYLHGRLMANSKTEAKKKTLKKKSKHAKIRNHFTAQEFKLIVHTLKNQLRAGDMSTIVDECYGDSQTAHKIKELLKEIKVRNLSKDKYNKLTNKYVKNISVMNDVLEHHLEVKLSSNLDDIYCFTRHLEFCIISIIT
jgi:hypothetical protein